jgi:hypothetical protein
MHGNGARFYLNVTAVSGTGGLTFHLRAYDPASGSTITLASDGSAITATGLYVFEIWPSGTTTAAGNRRLALQLMLPLNYDVNITVGDSSSYTYSLSVETGF